MVGIYFSGTGNTKFCVEQFLKGFEEDESFSIEDEKAKSAVSASSEIVFAYPVYYSDLPKIVRDFVLDNSNLWRGKKIFIIATMGLFSGDGTGCSARLFKRFGGEILGGLHLQMPDCIGDVKLLIKPLDKNKKIVARAEEKIDKAVKSINSGKYPKEGLGFFSRMAGLFGQRLYFSNKTKNYYAKTKADSKKCTNCGLCITLCPMQNIKNENGKTVFGGKCTMCYRCFSNCPSKAINIIGKQVFEQCKFENYQESLPPKSEQ